jgi:hypothetical protein
VLCVGISTYSLLLQVSFVKSHLPQLAPSSGMAFIRHRPAAGPELVLGRDRASGLAQASLRLGVGVGNTN